MILEALVAAAAALPAPAPAATPPAWRHACHTRACHRRVTNQRRRRVVRPYLPWLHRLEACESGGDPDAVAGPYTGLHQFDRQTWHSVGGHGEARDAGELEQRYRAVLLRKRRGTAPWPVCG